MIGEKNVTSVMELKIQETIKLSPVVSVITVISKPPENKPLTRSTSGLVFLNDWTIELNKIPSYSKFSSKTFYELVDVKLLLLLENDKRISPEQKLHLQNSISKVNNNNMIPVKYTQLMKGADLGRFYQKSHVIVLFRYQG